MLKLPDVRQRTGWDCGLACAEIVARFWGYPAAPLLAKLPATPLDGLDPRTLEAGLRAEGFNVLAGEMSLSDLASQTAQGRPVVCCASGHWVVVAGVTRSRVHYQDPFLGPRRERIDAWLARWCDGDRSGAQYDKFGISAWRSG